MPELGEVKRGKDIGHTKSTGGNHKYIWRACIKCSKSRWVYLPKANLSSGAQLCFNCANALRSINQSGDRHFRWKGGKTINRGYRKILLYSDSPFISMANDNRYVAEHRLVIAQYLGRCLQPWEIVHHKNGVKLDNRRENLELSTKAGHITEHTRGYQEGFDKGFTEGLQMERNKQIQELKQEIRLLQWQVKSLREEMRIET